MKALQHAVPPHAREAFPPQEAHQQVAGRLVVVHHQHRAGAPVLLHPADQPLWAKSALSLTYLVLDEFHTYDGAQGTDVALLLARDLGLPLTYSWLPLRRAMVRPDRDLLGGPDLVVEVDETMVGGVTAGTAGAGSDKVPVMIAVERPGGRRLGRIRLAPTTTPGTLKLVDFAATVIAPGATIRTDGARFLRRLGTMGYTHEYTVGLGRPDQESLLPGVHLSASLLKRWLTGTLHYAAAESHLPYYLDEFTFRFNRRSSASRGLLFYRLLQQAVDTAPHPLASLRATHSD